MTDTRPDHDHGETPRLHLIEERALEERADGYALLVDALTSELERSDAVSDVST